LLDLGEFSETSKRVNTRPVQSFRQNVVADSRNLGLIHEKLAYIAVGFFILPLQTINLQVAIMVDESKQCVFDPDQLLQLRKLPAIRDVLIMGNFERSNEENPWHSSMPSPP
jgi:hypothetical protein